MVYFDILNNEPILIPLDDTVGIKRIVILNNGNSESSTALLLTDNIPILFATTEVLDFTFPETPYGYPAPSCFLMISVGGSKARVMIETSPFVNPNYFELKEVPS